MKKQYIKPDTTVMNIEAESFCAASPGFSGDTGSMDIFEDGAQQDALSKGHSFDLWADDGEE